MKCYICGCNNIKQKKGVVRDSPKLQVLECNICGLVFLSGDSHISNKSYEDSGMHGAHLPSIESWLKECSWDDERRIKMLTQTMTNKRLLDFGCGAGGFLVKAKKIANDVVGVELEKRVQDFWCDKIKIYNSLSQINNRFDIVTAFHVIEHLKDPRATLEELSKLLLPNGKIVVEVPSADDALITMYDSDAFQNFTYWSQHLYLFKSSTLTTLANQAGFKVVTVKHIQRYPLSNHLYWLKAGQPGGHKIWGFLDTQEMTDAYSNLLAAIGKTDTLIAVLER